MATRRTRIASLLTAVAALALTAGVTLYYRHGSTTEPAARLSGEGAARSARQAESVPAHEPAPQLYEREAVRRRAQAALQECLKKAQLQAKTSWDGMCASLARRNAEQRDNCRQQGRAASACLSLYADTPVSDCLLPHQTASSVAQSERSAKSDCYQQFQLEMR